MCIKGFDNIRICGVIAGIIGDLVGGVLMMAGIAVYLTSQCSWSPLAIGLLASGGVIFTLGLGGGCVILQRVSRLEDQSDDLVQRVSQYFRQNKDDV